MSLVAITYFYSIPNDNFAPIWEGSGGWGSSELEALAWVVDHLQIKELVPIVALLGGSSNKEFQAISWPGIEEEKMGRLKL